MERRRGSAREERRMRHRKRTARKKVYNRRKGERVQEREGEDRQKGELEGRRKGGTIQGCYPHKFTHRETNLLQLITVERII